MKKLLTFLIAGVLVMIAFATLGPMVGFFAGAALTYWGVKSLLRAPSLLGKLGWGLASLVGLSLLVGNAPAVIGIGALVLLYYGYMSQKRRCQTKTKQTGYEKFRNFEAEWESLIKKS